MSARSRIRRVGIEAGEGLVEQHEPRFGGQRPGQGDPLALAAGQLVRVAAAVLREPDHVEPVVAARGPFRSRQRPEARTRCCRRR